MKGIVIRTALFDPMISETALKTKKNRTPHDMRHYVATMKKSSVTRPELHQSFLLCEAPNPQPSSNEYDLSMYYTMLDRGRILEPDDLRYPYHPTLKSLMEAWDEVHKFKPTTEQPGVVITEYIERQFYVEEHESGMLEDFIYLFDSGKIEAIITTDLCPFGHAIDGTYVLASKLYGGDWQPFVQFEEPWQVKSTIIG
jgi:hypothetical protein